MKIVPRNANYEAYVFDGVDTSTFGVFHSAVYGIGATMQKVSDNDGVVGVTFGGTQYTVYTGDALITLNGKLLEIIAHSTFIRKYEEVSR